jgi:hypothetical protein
MKHSPRRCETPAELSQSLHERLNAYALAASVAGVGMLALAGSAEAKIVYFPAHRVINPHDSFRLDLNHDGVTDFTLRNYTYCNTDQCFFKLQEKAAPGNGVVGVARGSFQPYASALNPGVRIGRGQRFYGKIALLAYVYYGGGGSDAHGKWVNVANRYLGLRFQIKGKTHYGWARLSVQVNKTLVTSTLTGYAYETVANRPIIAGKTKGPDEIAGLEATTSASFGPPTREPAALGLLALGAPGVSIWRREELLAAAQ